MDVLLFIPRLIWDILKTIWSVIKFIGEFLYHLIPIRLPDGSEHSWIFFIAMIVITLFAFWGRYTFGGFIKSFLTIIGCIALCLVLYAISPIGTIITIVVSLLIGYGKITPTKTVYTLLGLMWTGLLIYAVVG